VRVEVSDISREAASGDIVQTVYSYTTRDIAQNIYRYTRAAIVAVSGPVGPLPVQVVQQQVPSLRTSGGN